MGKERWMGADRHWLRQNREASGFFLMIRLDPQAIVLQFPAAG
jgi:hypothetical protein